MVKIDWNEPPLVKWLGTTSRKGTRNIYRGAFKKYAQFTGMTSEQLIDEALEDAKKDIRERKDIVKTRLLQFYSWLKEEYPIKSRGNGKHKIISKGLSDSSASTAVGAIRSFYSTYEIYVKMRGRQSLPKPKIVNKRMQLNTADIKLLVDHARSPRDREIILTMFQGGMDASTLCSIKYGDVNKGLGRGEHPLKLELFRKKSGTDYYTFLGHEAVEAIKAYIHNVESKGAVFEDNSPLFLKQSNKARRFEPLYSGLIANMLKKVAIASGLVNDKLNGKKFNPVSPHALRENFGSIMVNKGVPDSIVDFWLGHAVSDMAEAYKGRRFEELKRMYAERESFISITAPSSDLKKFEKSNQELKNVLVDLSTENKKLRDRIDDLEKFKKTTIQQINEIKEFRKEMKHYEKGGVVVTYHKKAGFLPGEPEEFSEKILKDRIESLEKEIADIKQTLIKRKN
jgi:integrase